MDGDIKELWDAIGGLRAKRGGANAGEFQNRHVSAAAPTDNDLLGWNDTTKKWEPKSDAPAARVYNSGVIAINDSTWTALTFDTERFDTDTIHSTASNTDRLTATTAGKYLVWGNIRWEGHATGRRLIDILHNNTTEIARENESGQGTETISMTITAIWDMAATDYVVLRVWQNCGAANLDIQAVSAMSPEFGMIRLGPTGSGGGGSHAAVTVGDTLHTLSTQEISGVAAGAAQVGHVELATTAEVTTGTDTGRAVTPSGLPSQIQDNKWVYWADSGAADAYVITPAPVIAAYAAGQMFHFKAINANTGASTLNVNAKGAVAITKNYNAALVANDIKANQIITVVYDGVAAAFQMQSQLGNAATAGAHGIASHTEHANWKALYTDGSGDEQELALGAAPSQALGHTYYRSAGAAANPTMAMEMREKTITVEDPAADEDIAVCFFFQAVTIREIEACIVGATSVTIDPYHHTSRAGGGGNDIITNPYAVAATTSVNIPGDAETLSDPTIPRDSWLILETTALSGTPTELSVTFRYTIDA